MLQLWEPVGPTGGATMNLNPTAAEGAVDGGLPAADRSAQPSCGQGPCGLDGRDVRSRPVGPRAEGGGVARAPRHTRYFHLRGSAGRLGDHLRMRAYGQSGSEFHSLREYVVGDDLRRISWKASARSPELIVKETALEGVKRCTVVLDTTVDTDIDADAETGSDADADADEAFERAVSVAASLVTGAAAAALATRFVAPDTDLRGHDVAPITLRWLATVSRGDGRPADLPSLKAGEGMGIVLVVTPSPAGTFAATVRASLGPDDTLVVVATRSSATRRDRFVVDATSEQAFHDGWAQLTGTMSSGLPRSYAVQEPA
ncbi:MAG: DUF58 domain-containing protein [Ilumatobacteraceae bacterium]